MPSQHLTFLTGLFINIFLNFESVDLTTGIHDLVAYILVGNMPYSFNPTQALTFRPAQQSHYR